VYFDQTKTAFGEHKSLFSNILNKSYPTHL